MLAVEQEEGGDGSESALSFLVRATIPEGTNTNAVELSGLSFGAGTVGFSVYRGTTPVQLLRIASGQAVANTFTDTGLASGLVPPPDANYDHANFYWRMELQPEVAATVHTATTAGNETLSMATNAFRGATVRIHKGKGQGQERTIAANDGTTLAISGHWDIEPDATSLFVVADPSWRFGAMGRTAPVEFDVPNRPGATVHVSGRAANVNDKECSYAVSPLTRWTIGGAGGNLDAGVPGMPIWFRAPC